MEFSLFFFSADGSTTEQDKYLLLRESAHFADTHGFTGIWTPERHFDPFGGLYPNPSVTSAALAMITQRIRLRAGSVVLPLHDPLRVAEEWAVVDNLSGGRVEVSFASGWHVNDFVLSPAAYANRKRIMLDGIRTFQRLWSGQPILRTNSENDDVEVRVFPRPVQSALPIWLTAQSDETFIMAGELGANVLTNFTGKRIEDLATKIRLYRSALGRGGYDQDAGKVALMLHTFVGTAEDEVRTKVEEAYSKYLSANLDLQRKQLQGKSVSEERAKIASISDDERAKLVSHAVDRLFRSNGLVGTQRRCEEIVENLGAIGITEVACLVDFGMRVNDVLESLHLVNGIRERMARAQNTGSTHYPE